MSLIYWYALALFIIMAWTAAMMALFYSKWKQPLENKGISLQGPFVLWKTVRGKNFIERFAEKRKRFVQAYGRLSVGLVAVTMATMTFFLFYSAFLVAAVARTRVLEPHELLGLPGLNPMIPLWYGIFAIAVAMIVHEFSHGILSSLAKVKIKSLGLLFFIFPMGAFVEPDEEELKKIEKKKRVRMFASGPSANLITAAVCSLIFSVLMMGGVQAAHDGVGITKISEGSPAEISGLEPGMIMTSFNNTPMSEYQNFRDAINNTRANQTVTIIVYQAGSTQPYNVILSDLSLETKDANDTGKGFLGVSTMTVSASYFHPITGADEQGGVVRSIATYVTLPLQGLSPVSGDMSEFYEVTGFWSNIPTGLFWIIANCFYWLFWLNLMVGLTNVLPAIPLDGGYIFKDWLDSLLARKEKYKEQEKRQKVVNKVALGLAFTILFLILWQLIGPRLMALG
jgi:membrane-associated protease RseP (regulator of RpoE activity)